MVMTSWSDLPYDVLEHIFSFLDLPDFHRLSAVCANWRSAAKERHYNSAPQVPWLVLGENSDTKKQYFYALSQGRHYSIDIPELYGRYICGSSHGWVFAIDIKINGILLNLLTRECYDLPPFPAYSNNINITNTLTEEPVSNGDGNQRRSVTFKWMQSRIVRRAMLSHDPKRRSDFTAMILFGGGPIRLAIWRPGNTAWTVVKSEGVSISDAICFKEEFYVLSVNDFLYKVDMGSDPKIERLILHVPSNIPMERMSYLVDFKGQLLLVLRSHEHCTTITFYVLVLNLEEGTWDEWDDLDDHALFVGSSSALVLDVARFPSCVKNGVYYTDMTGSYYWLEYRHDCGIFNMVDETIQQFYPIEEKPNLPVEQQLLWFTPNP